MHCTCTNYKNALHSTHMSSKLKYSLTSNNKVAKCANSDVLLLKINILACNKVKELRQLKSCPIS